MITRGNSAKIPADCHPFTCCGKYFPSTSTLSCSKHHCASNRAILSQANTAHPLLNARNQCMNDTQASTRIIDVKNRRAAPKGHNNRYVKGRQQDEVPRVSTKQQSPTAVGNT